MKRLIQIFHVILGAVLLSASLAHGASYQLPENMTPFEKMEIKKGTSPLFTWNRTDFALVIKYEDPNPNIGTVKDTAKLRTYRSFDKWDPICSHYAGAFENHDLYFAHVRTCPGPSALIQGLDHSNPNPYQFKEYESHVTIQHVGRWRIPPQPHWRPKEVVRDIP